MNSNYHRISVSEKEFYRNNWSRSLTQKCSAKSICQFVQPVVIIFVVSTFFWWIFYFDGTVAPLPLISRFVPQHLLQERLKSETSHLDSKPKKILAWTAYYKNPNFVPEISCPQKCEVTSNRNELESADALFFSAVDLEVEHSDGCYKPKDMPLTRALNKPWVIALFESPEHAPVHLKAFAGVFNWTWSYRSDSDISGSPLFTELKNNEEKNADTELGSVTETILKRKNKFAAWIVSNCDMQPSNRKYLVKLLRKHIPVDIYGKCGTENCSSPTGISCYKEIGSHYKFYFAFENSLCADYVTEKLFFALEAGMLPVVYGLGNYSIVAPRKSYINALEFDSVKALADYLIYLDTHPKEYLKYFEWRKFYKMDTYKKHRNFLCDLCDKIWSEASDNITQMSHPDLWDWWTHFKSPDGKKIWACFRPGFKVNELNRIPQNWMTY